MVRENAPWIRFGCARTLDFHFTDFGRRMLEKFQNFPFSVISLEHKLSLVFIEHCSKESRIFASWDSHSNLRALSCDNLLDHGCHSAIVLEDCEQSEFRSSTNKKQLVLKHTQVEKRPILSQSLFQ